MPVPAVTARDVALEKRRRLKEGVFFYLYDKKRWNPDVEFTDDIIKYYSSKYKRKVCQEVEKEYRKIQKEELVFFRKPKKMDVPWDIEKHFIDKKQFIYDLIDIELPE